MASSKKTTRKEHRPQGLRVAGMDKTLTVRVPEELVRRLIREADAAHTDYSDYVRESLAVRLDVVADMRRRRGARGNGAAATHPA